MARTTLSGLLCQGAVATGVEATDWRDAISAAGGLLMAVGAVTEDYIVRMQRVVETHGPYIVVAPGLALAHARPCRAVLRTGLSLAGLAAPVRFGHPENDPVRLVIGLAGVDRDRHCAVLAELTAMLDSPGRLAALHGATTPARVRSLVSAYDRGR
ncbi:PTS sugar transporter subunit IIA [Nocardiopsis ansamitocini]|uniref:Ascorbate-specific PTS system EIIA component n=1 Tax=Nocardiopsis ansamitocini TaxID=1670832 RepID=A0A9W6P6A0_9ACTN|nr:PTS sugar transporter subunit IIA [Nocardiopsis ansamitocini]GLU47827.1 PTS ascorbate transporter subunit IIA [Nocardiopsis ansamitocini]